MTAETNMATAADMSPTTLAKAIVERACKQKIIIVLAESCTGGLIASALTDIPGSSAVLDRGFVTYSNDAKIDLLGVSDKTLADHGAVSAETAIAMTAGALAATPRAALAASVTGIAGPGGGSPDKPVGLVHFSCQRRGNAAQHERHIFTGDRETVRKKALLNALTMIYNKLK